MSDAPIVRARTTTALAPRASEQNDQLDVHLRRARAIASAGDAVPKSYRGNTGAVLLASEWAASRGLDLLTAIQSVSFIDGKPVVDATMQRALAKRAGYRTKITEATLDRATVEVWEDGELLGSATYTTQDAKIAGLDQKPNWKKNPKAMLVARATTTAMRWHAPDVLTGVFAEDEDLGADPVEVLTATATIDPEPEPEPEPEPAEDIAEAEVVDPVDGPITPATRGALKAAVDLAKAEDRWEPIAEVIEAEGLPSFSRLTERQARRVLELCEVA